MNNTLLNKIKAHIRKEPRRIWMSEWINHNIRKDTIVSVGYERPGQDYAKVKAVPPCGTIGCISGWASILSNEEHSTYRSRELLMVDFKQGERLFYVHYWPHKFKMAYRKAKTAKGRAKVVCDRITHFQKTKGKE